MSDVVVVSNDSDDDTAEEIEEAADDIADALGDVVMDSTTIALVERVTRLEDALAIQSAVIEEISNQLQSLQFHEEVQDMAIENTNEAVAEVATEAADAVEEVVEDIDEASEEITPDEVPTIREHPFFRKWGRS